MQAFGQVLPYQPFVGSDPTEVPCRNRKLAAILMADAVGFSRVVQQDERGTLKALRDARRRFSSLTNKYCGRVVDTAGDSVLAEFPSVIGAVSAAIEFQSRAVPPEQATSPHDLLFRVGIHLGDVISEDGAIFGDGVNIAARLQSHARAGGILVSRAVYDEAKGKLPVTFRPRGRPRLKNMASSIVCFDLQVGDARQPILSRLQRVGRDLSPQHAWLAAITLALACAAAWVIG